LEEVLQKPGKGFFPFPSAPLVTLYGFHKTGNILHVMPSGNSKPLLPLRNPEFRESVRARSKAVLGNKDRAEVGAAIGLDSHGLVNATDLSLELNLPNSRVRAQLLALAEGGYLEPAPSLSGRKAFERRPSTFWETCIELIETTPSPASEEVEAGTSSTNEAA
jgi:hypothetical protein